MTDPLSEKQQRMADTVRLVVTHRERAPRSPRMEQALKRLIWRYNRALCDKESPSHCQVPSEAQIRQDPV
jgi:hypothetical protein